MITDTPRLIHVLFLITWRAARGGSERRVWRLEGTQPARHDRSSLTHCRSGDCRLGTHTDHTGTPGSDYICGMRTRRTLGTPRPTFQLSSLHRLHATPVSTPLTVRLTADCRKGHTQRIRLPISRCYQRRRGQPIFIRSHRRSHRRSRRRSHHQNWSRRNRHRPRPRVPPTRRRTRSHHHPRPSCLPPRPPPRCRYCLPPRPPRPPRHPRRRHRSHPRPFRAPRPPLLPTP